MEVVVGGVQHDPPLKVLEPSGHVVKYQITPVESLKSRSESVRSA